MRENTGKRILLEFLDFFRYKVDNDLLTMEEVESLAKAIEENVKILGTAESGNQHLNTIIHEIFHNSVNVASEMGADLRGEVPAYVAGDTADILTGVICQIACGRGG